MVTLGNSWGAGTHARAHPYVPPPNVPPPPPQFAAYLVGNEAKLGRQELGDILGMMFGGERVCVCGGGV